MPKFLAVYLGSPDSMSNWEKLSDSERSALEAKGISAWTNWVKKNEKSIIEVGSPLGATLRVDKKGVSEIVNELTAYTVVEAPSHEAAARLFTEHPHFTVFPGHSIEVMECIPLPGA